MGIPNRTIPVAIMRIITMMLKQTGSARVWLNCAIVLIFAGTLLTLIFYLNTTEPDIRREQLKLLSHRMQENATRAGYQWQVEGRPVAIMLLHYDTHSKETGRKPVKMATNGLPKVETGDDQCTRLWQSLVNEPLQLDGFKVSAEYIPIADHDSQTGPICRFGVSRGSHFDYAINSGTVIFTE